MEQGSNEALESPELAVTPGCTGTNCGTTTNDHSSECVAEHDALVSPEAPIVPVFEPSQTASFSSGTPNVQAIPRSAPQVLQNNRSIVMAGLMAATSSILTGRISGADIHRSNTPKRSMNRVPANTEAGRKIMAHNAPVRQPAKLSPEVAAWNAAVDKKKEEKLRARMARKIESRRHLIESRT